MKIRNLADLAEHLGCDTASEIKHHLRHNTESGIGFGIQRGPGYNYVWLQGQCEGSDADFPDYCLNFPIDSDEFDHTVDEADHDGLGAWDTLHDSM